MMLYEMILDPKPPTPAPTTFSPRTSSAYEHQPAPGSERLCPDRLSQVILVSNKRELEWPCHHQVQPSFGPHVLSLRTRRLASGIRAMITGNRDPETTALLIEGLARRRNGLTETDSAPSRESGGPRSA